jgi:glycogen debranching enzyme
VVSAANYGENLFVWDHYHAGLRFAWSGQPEYCQYLCNNVLHYQEPDGFTPSCILAGRGSRGSSSRFHAQPYLARAAWAFFQITRDLVWVDSVLPKLQAYLDYYDRQHLTACGLHVWAEPFHSGIDNDAVTTFHLPGVVVPCDLSSLLVLEHRALAALKKELGDTTSVASEHRAGELAEKIRRTLWCEEAGTFAAFHLASGNHVLGLPGWEKGQPFGEFAFQSCSNLLPLYAGVAEQSMAERMIQNFVLSPEHFWSDWGIRSLSKSSGYYNNAIWGNPPRFGDHRRMTNSNWQGPVWIPLCFFVHRALKRYGFSDEAVALEGKVHHVLSRSLETVGSFAENFCAETGAPLYAREFGAWNLLGDILHHDLPFEFPPENFCSSSS